MIVIIKQRKNKVMSSPTLDLINWLNQAENAKKKAGVGK